MTPTQSVPLSAPLYGASMGKAISRFFRKYATFHGRASPSEFWWWALFSSLVYFVIAVVALGVGLATGELNADGDTFHLGAAASAGVAILAAWALITAIPQIAVTVRRLHDANLTGWLFLLSFLPSVGSLILLVLTVLPAKPEGARFDRA